MSSNDADHAREMTIDEDGLARGWEANQAGWRRSSAEAEGVDPAGIRSLIDDLDGDPTQDPHALVVVRHGAVIASAQWEPYALDRPQLVYSLSKSFTSTAAGFAAAEGLLDLDAPAADYFPEYADSVARASRGILVRHLASMATGHLNDMIVAFAMDPEHPIKAFLGTPPEREPGSVFTYNQLATYTLGAIVQRRSGVRLSEYLRPRLLEPLGIAPVGWQQEPVDVELGFSGLFTTPESVAKLGQLYLRHGVWNGKRLLSESWVRQATSLQVDNALRNSLTKADSDWEQGYGFQFWMARHGYRGDGAFGQYCIVLPEHDAVVAITSQTVDMQDLLNRVWKHLLPAFRDEPLQETGGGDALHGIRRGIGFPIATAQEGASEEEFLSLTELDAAAAGEYQRSAEDVSLEEYETLTSVALEREHGSGASGWRVVVREQGSAEAAAIPPAEATSAAEAADGWLAAVAPERTSTTPTGTVGGLVGDGEWVVTNGGESGTLEVPVAVRGGIRSSDGVLRIDVAFIDTPHRLTLSFDLGARTVTPRWVTRSLGFSGAYQLRAVRPGESFAVQR
ncbi:serine hydrolase domain-containing protein [Rathayibacter sp. KR2-224]|uniref:serine hydrolase domain-containing protein n=1 Tax=Rathayibacter sp. KR2-224 TaxID=3400913 RepID=UPI003C096777